MGGGGSTTTVRRLVERTALILGGQRALAQRLQVSESTIQSWRHGEVDPPWPEFQQMLDILLTYVEALTPG